MKLIRWILAISLATLAVGCHAQVPPATTQAVNLTWTASTDLGCTGTCALTYTVYRCSAGAACADLSNTGWTQVGTSTVASYTDSTPPVSTDYYAVEAVVNSQNSAASNIVQVAVNALAVPTAPALNTPTAQSALLDRQSLPQSADKQMAANVALNLKARLAP